VWVNRAELVAGCAWPAVSIVPEGLTGLNVHV